MLGTPWKGTGAYNSRYQTNHSGPLENDPLEVAEKISGPNAYVTQRWRTKLAPHEARLIDLLFREPMRLYGYKPIMPLPSPEATNPAIVKCLMRPFRGEFPGLDWVRKGADVGPRELLRRAFYLLAAPLFAMTARIMFLKLANKCSHLRAVQLCYPINAESSRDHH